VARITEAICAKLWFWIVQWRHVVELKVHYFIGINHPELHTPEPATNQDTLYSNQQTTTHEINMILMIDMKTGNEIKISSCLLVWITKETGSHKFSLFSFYFSPERYVSF
jgi:hypothetical protein